jgi:hypothetical protein
MVQPAPPHSQITDDATFTTPANREALYYRQTPTVLETVTS